MKFRNFKTDPPTYTQLQNGNLVSPEIIVSNANGNMAIVQHYKCKRIDGSNYDSWDVSGIDGYEWDFNLDDIEYWAEKPVLELSKVIHE